METLARVSSSFRALPQSKRWINPIAATTFQDPIANLGWGQLGFEERDVISSAMSSCPHMTNRGTLAEAAGGGFMTRTRVIFGTWNQRSACRPINKYASCACSDILPCETSNKTPSLCIVCHDWASAAIAVDTSTLSNTFLPLSLIASESRLNLDLTVSSQLGSYCPYLKHSTLKVRGFGRHCDIQPESAQRPPQEATRKPQELCPQSLHQQNRK